MLCYCAAQGCIIAKGVLSLCKKLLCSCWLIELVVRTSRYATAALYVTRHILVRATFLKMGCLLIRPESRSNSGVNTQLRSLLSA